MLAVSMCELAAICSKRVREAPALTVGGVRGGSRVVVVDASVRPRVPLQRVDVDRAVVHRWSVEHLYMQNGFAIL